MGSPYSKGRAGEYYIQSLAAKKGYVHIRSAHSEGAADTILGNGVQVVLVQVKAWDSKLAHLSEEERRALVEKAFKFKAIPVFARKNQGRWELLRLWASGTDSPFTF